MANERKRHPYLNEPEGRPEIRMVWHAVAPPPKTPALPLGYRLRQVWPDEKEAYEDLYALAWPLEYDFQEFFDFALPEGFFAIEHVASGLLVSSCITLKPGVFKEYSHVGTLGWLVTDPAHGGLGLATTVVLAVMNRLYDEGYRESYLGTEDERLVAIHIYLKLGWKPLLYKEGMEERWRSIREALAARGNGNDPES